jgi:hypothetical protein
VGVYQPITDPGVCVLALRPCGVHRSVLGHRA